MLTQSWNLYTVRQFEGNAAWGYTFARGYEPHGLRGFYVVAKQSELEKAQCSPIEIIAGPFQTKDLANKYRVTIEPRALASKWNAQRVALVKARNIQRSAERYQEFAPMENDNG